VLQGSEPVASLLLVVFSVGVGIGALGMTLFDGDLYFASRSLPPAPDVPGLGAFLAQPAH